VSDATKAQVLLFSEPRRAVVEEQALPAPGPGELQLRVEATLVSIGTDLTAYNGEFPRDRPSSWGRYVQYPFRPGYSATGVVAAVGAGVGERRVGQRVFAAVSHCSAANVPVERTVPLPDALPAEEGAFAMISTIAQTGVRLAHLELGDAVAIVGMGIVGELAAQYAHLDGAFPLIAIDLSDRRLEIAERVGATHAVNPGQEELAARVAEITKGRKLDAAFEVTGNPTVIPTLPPLIKRGGKLILLGSPRGPSTIDLHDDVHTFGLKVIGAHGSNLPPVESQFNQWTWARSIELFFDLLVAGRLHVRDLITHRIPGRESPEAFRMLAEDRTSARGVILTWG
jgi:2-desacetyl-2-hydroxyethyl bacteriochlorophyllide A dehydrogenase